MQVKFSFKKRKNVDGLQNGGYRKYMWLSLKEADGKVIEWRM